MNNPFPVNHYISPAYFCDRLVETNDILEAIHNRRSLTLHAIRRVGKTSLIHHVFHQLESKKDFAPVYIDIFDITTAQDFLNLICSSVINALEKSKEGFIKRAVKYLNRYRPVFSIDAHTGNPSVSLDIKNDEDFSHSLDLVFSFIKEQKKTFVLAIDEFQQINHFDIKTIPATLRKHMQNNDKIVFIFSGSQRDLLLNLTSSPKQALYRSTQMMPLRRISSQDFQVFISSQLKRKKCKITDEIILDGIEWTMSHTYYTLFYFNRLYSNSNRNITKITADETKKKILLENQVVFHNYKNLMTAAQWKLLKAIGSENVVSQPTSQKFLATYKLGAHSSVVRSLQFLLESEMIYEEYNPVIDKKEYRVYDVFLSRWLENI